MLRRDAERYFEIEHKDGTKQPRMRRTLSGRTVPIAQETKARPWQVLLTRWRQATGGAYAQPDHPSRKHDLRGLEIHPVTIEVAGPVPGQPRRRDRRAAERQALKETR